MHLPALVEDLGLILIAAAIVTLLFKKLKQPIVLGYLIAGFLVGPNTTFFPSVKDTASISIWAEIGVIFMLFGLGLEFSFKKLVKVGKAASITASVEIFAMLGVGFVTGQILGWNKMDSLFLGGILSISSTTIIVRAFDELGLKARSFVSLVFGVLIVEDLIAILLLVLLTSVAATQTLSGSELTYSSLRLGFFLVLWFLLGIYLLPILLQKSRELLSDETLLIVSLGLCLMMVIVASHAGFSPALGAFVMGSILAETPKRKRIEHIILPVQNLFSAVFFVSVGMLISAKVLMEYYDIILLITVITVVGKVLSTSLGAIISGRSVKHSVQAGMSLAQIGEFSFIIATLGMTLKVTSEFLYPVAVTVSALTTFSTPYLIKLSDPFANWLEKSLPAGMKASLARYEMAMSSSQDSNVLMLIWRAHGIKVALNAVVVVAISLFVSRFVVPLVSRDADFQMVNMIACVLTLLASGPFLWGIFFGRPTLSKSLRSVEAEQLRRLQFGVSIVRFLIGCGVAAFIVSNYTSVMAFSGIVLVSIAALFAVLFSRFSEPIYRHIENRFVSNLTENERAELEKKSKTPQLAPWNATLMEFVLSPSSPLILKTLQESRVKEQFGITIAMIERGDSRILAPKRDDLLLPGDKLFVIGTDEQLSAVREEIEKVSMQDLPALEDNFGLASLVLHDENRFVNRPIRDCGLREAVDGLIVGIERNGVRILSPDSATHLLPGDLIWIVGDKRLIRDLRNV